MAKKEIRSYRFADGKRIDVLGYLTPSKMHALEKEHGPLKTVSYMGRRVLAL